MLKFKKGQLTRLLIVLLLLAFAYTYLLPWAFTMQVGSTTTSLSIAFEGSGEGLDPQGNRFDINEIKSEKVLAAAIEKAGLGDTTTVGEVSDRIYILPQAGQDTLKQLLTLATINGKTQDVKEQIIYPTTFLIGLRDIGIPSALSDRKLLTALCSSYKDYLKSRYLADSTSEPAYTDDEILAMDYPEMMEVLAQRTETIERYVKIYAENEPQFVSTETGLTFADLSERINVLKDTDIRNMQSLVSYYRLTKDPEGRIQYEEALLKRALVIATKMQGAQLTTNEILQIYNNNSNYLFASADSGNANLAPVENQFYNDLMAALVDRQTEYIDAKYNQLDITRAIEKMKSGMLEGEAYDAMTDRITSGTKTILTQIEEMQKTARTMASEYYDEGIGNKIGFSGVSYGLQGNGSLLINYIVLVALVILVRLIIVHLYDSEYGVYLEKINYLFHRKTRKRKCT